MRKTMPKRESSTSFGEFIKGLREKHRKSKEEVTEELRVETRFPIGQNSLGQWEKLKLGRGIRTDYLVALAKHYMGEGDRWEWNEVMGLFGAPPPQGFDRIASEIAARPALREHFAMIRQWDDPQIRQLTASLRSVPPTHAVKNG